MGLLAGADTKAREESPVRADADLVAWLCDTASRVLARPSLQAADDLLAGPLQIRRLIALRAAIDAHYGFRPALVTIVEARTMGSLADAIAARRDLPASRSVMLGPGEGAPLFVVPGLSGWCVEMNEVARSLPSTQPVCIVQAVGIDGFAAPLPSIAAIAADHAAVIRSVQPHGPYRIAGYSFGGVVAIEAARLLMQEGEAVPFVGIIETPILTRFWPWSVCVEALSYLAVRGWVRAGHGGSVARLRFLGRGAVTLVRRLIVMAGVKREAHVVRQTPLVPEALQRVHQVHADALTDYVPQPFAGDVTAFHSETDTAVYRYSLKVWPRFVRRFRPVAVAGGHKTMLRGRHAGELAALIAREAAVS